MWRTLLEVLSLISHQLHLSIVCVCVRVHVYACMCIQECVGVRDLHLYNLEFTVRQMVEMYMKAVHAVGACATIKLA